MKKVLWISRHEMTPLQKSDLDRVMGDRVELISLQNTIHNVDEVRSSLPIVDAVAVVLPPDMLQQLLAIVGDKPVLRAVSNRKPTGRMLTLQDGRQEPEFAFVHVYWEQVLSVDIRTRRL